MEKMTKEQFVEKVMKDKQKKKKEEKDVIMSYINERRRRYLHNKHIHDKKRGL